ncbi:MAG: F0F1 ATP synthase subunit gamma [bacterium]|nr:F0F1 ATP synthase subunit gamma [bacterium]
MFEPGRERPSPVLRARVPAQPRLPDALREASACEHGARMTAMGSAASENAGGHDRGPHADAQPRRQAAITQEITRDRGAEA